MNHALTLLTTVVLSLAGVAAAQQASPEAGQAMGRASGAAEQELAKSIASLNEIRAEVAAEKLPLAQELTTLEETVIQLRRDADKVQRLVDAGALEIATIQADMRARQDEISYIGNLLDEYARTFETKVGVGEMQVYGQAAEAAKEAFTNKTLSPTEKFRAQATFTALTIKRIFDVLGGTRFAGIGVDMLGTVMQGQYALIGPIALFRSDGGEAGVAVPQAGSPNPLVRPLDPEASIAVAALIASGEGTMPLDPSRGGALKALVAKANIVDIFIKGGPIMWPMLLVSLIGLAVVIERVIFLLLEQRKRSPKTLDKFFAAVAKGDLSGAIGIAKQSKDAIVATMGYALERRDQSISHALAYAETRTLKRYRRGISILDTVITLAPLLGLLGTVTGMMGSFAVIGGDLSSPGAITGGIAEALIATAFGLLIAIVCLIPFNYLNTRIEGVETELLAAGEQLKLLMEGRGPTHPGPEHGGPAAGAPRPGELSVSSKDETFAGLELPDADLGTAGGS